MAKSDTPARPRAARQGRNGRGGITFDDFVGRVYLPHAKIRKRSWQTEERIARKYISPFFGHRKLDSLTACEISAWHEDLRVNGFSQASCNRFLAVFRTVLDFAATHGLLARSPCLEINYFKCLTRPGHVLSQAEAAMLMDELAAMKRPEANALRLILLTGAKKGEIINARWEDVNLDRMELAVGVAISGIPRKIILSRAAVELLAEMRRERTGPWLFPGRSGQKPISDIYHFWNSLRVRFGLEGVRIQDLRHSVASFLVNTGCSLYEVQELLGHSHPCTTRKYFQQNTG